MQMCPLMLRIRMQKDSILDAGNDHPLVPHIDSDHVSNMNWLAIVVAHSMTSQVEAQPEAWSRGLTKSQDRVAASCTSAIYQRGNLHELDAGANAVEARHALQKCIGEKGFGRVF